MALMTSSSSLIIIAFVQSWLGEPTASEGCALHQLIVIGMSADLEPHNQPAFASPQSPVALVDSDRPNLILQWFEMERLLKTVLCPKFVLLPRNPLNFLRQSIEASPKLRMGPRNHGIARVLFLAISASTRAKSLSNFPAVRSRFICLSHASSLQE